MSGDKNENLIEPQGVNSEDDETGEDKETSAPPPKERSQSGALSDEMVGLPDQKPGYPGQQGSAETG